MATKKAEETQEVQEAPAEPVEGFDETVPGGRYIQNGKVVNAHGKEIEGLSVKDGAITGTAKKTEE